MHITRRAALGATLAIPALATAQEVFPNRPVNVVVPWGPGGPTDTFARNPTLAASAPIVVNTGSVSYTVRITPAPTCYRVRIVKNSELNPGTASDAACIRSGTVSMPGVQMPTPGEAGKLADNSLCADTEWNIRAEVVDARSGAKVAVNQGAALRMVQSDAINLCK